VSYRDDRDALLAQAEALRRDLAAAEARHGTDHRAAAEVARLHDALAELRAENRALRDQLPPRVESPPAFSSRDLRSFAIAFAMALAVIGVVAVVAAALP
jgi:hypothetical protein